HSSVNRPNNKLTNSAVVERISDNLDSLIASYDRTTDQLKQIQENMHKQQGADERYLVASPSSSALSSTPTNGPRKMILLPQSRRCPTSP
ncbi:hypothetical protein EJB05_25904, partial [Eragrostis curvula]